MGDDVVDDGRRFPTLGARGMLGEVGGPGLVPFGVIPTLASGRAGLVEAGFALCIGRLLAFAPETGGNGSAAPT